MINPITGAFQADMHDLVRTNDKGTACKTCGVLTKELYSTDHGYVCKQHINPPKRKKREDEEV